MSSEYLSRLAYKQARLAYTKPVKNVELQATMVTGLSESDDGTTNGTIIQTAINNATAGDIIQLPEGTFKTTQLTINKDLYIQGVAGKTTLVNPTDDNYVMTLMYVTGAVSSSTKSLLTKAAKLGDNTLYVASTSGLTAGQWIFVMDGRTMADWNSQDTINQDIVQVESIVSATEIRLRTVLTRTYLVNRSAEIRVFTTQPPQVTVEGIGFSRGRLDLNFAANCYVRYCTVEQSEMASFSFRNCTGCVMEDCSTESPNIRTATVAGQTFYFYNSAFCTVIRHVARWCEGAVLRRGTRFCKIVDCRFEGATTGLATYSGDCHHNTVESCTFVDAILTWGAGGHYSDSFNVSKNCTFIANNTVANVIGNGGSAISEQNLGFDGRALSTSSTNGHGFENGQSFMVSGTTVPNELTKARRYFAICPTYGTALWSKEFLASEAPAKPLVFVTFDNTNKDVDMGAGWATGDAVVFDGSSLPSGLDANRIYFLRNRTANKFYLQARAGQTATFDNTTDRVTLTSSANEEWEDGDKVMFVTSGTLPAELTAAPTVYYLRDKSGADSFKLATTLGGTAIELSTNGSGTIYAVRGITSAGSGSIAAYGGTPIALTGSTSAAKVTTIAEGNIFEGHTIFEPPANAIYMHRCAGTLYRDITMQGARNPEMGSCMFTLLNCTDVIAENCYDINGLNVTYNRISHLTTCFNVKFIGGLYSKRTPSNLITGGTSEDVSVINVSISSLGYIDNLFGSSIYPNARAQFTPELVETITYATPKQIHLGLQAFKKITLTGDLELTGTGYVAGSTVKLQITPGSSTRNLTFPADWVFVPAKPATIAANKVGLLTLHSTSGAATGVLATWEVQS